jgi:hypothetical protein
VIEEAEADRLGGLVDAGGDVEVGGTGIERAARVVVGEAEGGPAGDEDGGDDVADGCEGVVAPTFADEGAAEHGAPWVADHHDQPLLGVSVQQGSGGGGDVGRAGDAAALRLGLRPPYEMERGGDAGGLGGTDSWHGEQPVRLRS